MKVRIKFQKYGAMKFIGHLDVMRYFQKAFRRAGIDNEYTKGYSPHQIMSFAAPLGVGLTSEGEYVDVQLLSSDSPEVMIERMNEVLTEGFRITGFHFLKDREENQKNVTAMALVASADYLVSLKDGYKISDFICNQEEFKKAFLCFMDQKEIVIDKKTKKSETAVNIRPMISFVAFDEVEYNHKLKDTLKEQTVSRFNIGEVADEYENSIKVYLQVDTGSAVNLKPELVMEAFYGALKIPYDRYAWQVHRIEVYAIDAETDKRVPLDQVNC